MLTLRYCDFIQGTSNFVAGSRSVPKECVGAILKDGELVFN